MAGRRHGIVYVVCRMLCVAWRGVSVVKTAAASCRRRTSDCGHRDARLASGHGYDFGPLHCIRQCDDQVALACCTAACVDWWVGRGAGMKITAGAKPAIANNTIVGNTAETLFVSKTAKVRSGYRAHTNAMRNMQPHALPRSRTSARWFGQVHARPAAPVRQRS